MDNISNSELDIQWIKQYENDETRYKLFYTNSITNLRINILYINKFNELEKINETFLNLKQENKITKEEIIKLIKQNERIDTIKYNLISIQYYKINLDEHNLKYFIKTPNNFDFLENIRHIEDYTIGPGISYLTDVFTMYIIFNENEKPSQNTKNTKNTKRVRFNLVHKKTKRRK